MTAPRPAATASQLVVTTPPPATTAPLPAATAGWLGQPALRRLWDSARRRLETNGLQPRGTLRLGDVTVEEREAFGQLLGGPVPLRDGAAAIRLDLLDARLRASAAARGLVGVLTALGQPVQDRAGARRASRDAWDQVWADAAHAAGLLGDEEWPHRWLSAIRQTGSLTRLGPQGASALLAQAVTALAAIVVVRRTETEHRVVGRGELAQQVTGTAHGLDDGTVLARLVLRGIATAAGEDPAQATRDAPARRALWRSAGVVVDEVSSTVLTYGLRPAGGGWRERGLLERADHGQETHLTLREVAVVEWGTLAGTGGGRAAGALVRVCENPRVVEAAAAAGLTDVALVCTAGNPSTVVLDLLGRLRDAGARLSYHGDFDWPGVALANRVATRFGAGPWRMSADDYERAVGESQRRAAPALALRGEPVEAVWDPELAASMIACGVAIHEESVLETLLTDLGAPAPAAG